MLVEVYSAPTDKSCRGGGFDVSRLEIWRQASLRTAKKIRRQRIRGILEKDQNETQEELAESLVTQQAVSVRLRGMGMIQKQGNWVPYELKLRDVERRFFTCEQLIQRQQRKIFCIGLWLEMRSGYSTTRRKNTMLSSINRCHRSQHQHYDRTFMVRRTCSVSGRIKRVLFIMRWKPSDSIMGDRYRLQLIRLSRALREKRPEKRPKT